MVSWQSVPLTKCIQRIGMPAKIPRKQFEGSGRFPIVSQEKELINGYWSDESAVISVESPLVVFGDHTQVLKYIDFDFVAGADGVKLLQPKSFLNAKYFYYFLMANPIAELGYARHYRLLKVLDVRFPESLSEQERIVFILDEAFAAIATARANAEKNLANARELFESYLNVLYNNENITWSACPLADILDRITYGFTNPMPTTEEGPYMVTARNVNEGRIMYEHTRRTSLDAFETLLTDKSRPKIGDILLTKDGTLGRLAVVDQDNICVNQSVAVLRPNNQVDSHFLKYLLSSPGYQRRMIDDAGGTTIKHIYITRVDKMKVAFPSLSEQKRLVEKIDNYSVKTEKLKIMCQQKLDSIAELKQSILQKAFSGELTGEPDKILTEARL